MVQSEMSRQRLAEIVAAFGAASERWPAAERAAAEALVARSTDARALLAEARELDALLDAAPDATATPVLLSRIMASRPAAARPGHAAPGLRSGAGRGAPVEPWRALVRAVWPYGSPAFPAGALAFSIVLGLTIGFTSPTTVTALGISASTGTSTSSASGTAGDQLVALALADNDYPEEWKQ
jgi:hypothetical protein